MSAPGYVYLVSLKGESLPLIAFTRKYSSQYWAEKQFNGLEVYERWRMRAGYFDSRTLCPWEEKV